MPAQALSIVVSKVAEREARQALRSSHLWGDDDIDGSGGGVGSDDNDSDDDIYIMMKCLCVCHEK